MAPSARVIFIEARRGRTNSTHNPAVEIALIVAALFLGMEPILPAILPGPRGNPTLRNHAIKALSPQFLNF
jgi:hypothetical protein